MQKTKVNTAFESDTSAPATLAAHYVNLFARHMPAMGDFDDFLQGLETLVGKDAYLLGFAELGEASTGGINLPDFELLGENETVVAVCGETGNQGFIQYSGKRDGSAFDAGDMHLMGAIAGFISLLTSQAGEFRNQSRAAKVLQYIINQLPLGVVCYGDDGATVVESKLASRLLGESGGAPLSTLAMDATRFCKGREQLHLEVDGKLLYVEGRRLIIEEQLAVTAFVLYDLSNYQYKLADDLEREAFRSESRGAPFSLAVLQAAPDSLPGTLYHLLQSSADKLQVAKSAIHPLDAYQCACLFSGKALPSTRMLLRKLVGNKDHVARMSLLQYGVGEDIEDPAEFLLEQAGQTMEVAKDALLPRVLAMDPYPGIADGLRIATAEVCHIEAFTSSEETVLAIKSGAYDGLFIGLDDCAAETLSAIQEAARCSAQGFRLFYLSYRQPAMARVTARLDESAIVFQKPFRTKEICECLSLEFK